MCHVLHRVTKLCDNSQLTEGLICLMGLTNYTQISTACMCNNQSAQRWNIDCSSKVFKQNSSWKLYYVMYFFSFKYHFFSFFCNERLRKVNWGTVSAILPNQINPNGCQFNRSWIVTSDFAIFHYVITDGEGIISFEISLWIVEARMRWWVQQ